MELIITPFFWLLLWDAEKKKRNDDIIGLLGLCLDHALPMVILLVEYVFLSAIPFSKRHFIGIVLICMIYLSINLTITLVSGRPVYDPMSWTDPMGIIIPIAVIFVALGLGFLMECGTRKKLARQGHYKICSIITCQTMHHSQ